MQESLPIKPSCLKKDHLEYLDCLRESGITNMFGAASYLEKRFNLKQKDARDVLIYWMKTF